MMYSATLQTKKALNSGADSTGTPLLVIGGGSNMLVSDNGFDGIVLHIASDGVEALPIPSCGGANVRVQAGTNWDEFVQTSIENSWVGPAPARQRSWRIIRTVR